MIPSEFHWIWVGPNPFPEKDKEWLQSWRDRHPSWGCTIWAEHPENVTAPGFDVQPLPALVNRWAFDAIEEWVGPRAKYSAQSDIVRAEVVARFGGVYLDTDVLCLRSIDTLLGGVRLFISEEWGADNCGNNGSFMFGATKNHPAAWELIRWLPGRLKAEREKMRKTKRLLNPVDCPGPHYINEHLKKHSDCVVFPQRLFNPLSAFCDPSKVQRWPEESYGNHMYDGKWYDRVKDPPPAEFLQEAAV